MECWKDGASKKIFTTHLILSFLCDNNKNYCVMDFGYKINRNINLK